MKLFQLNGAFFLWSNRLANVFLLTLVTLLASVPLITIGAAWQAFYRTSLAMESDPLAHVFAEFWAAFKQGWRQGTQALLVLAIGDGVLGLMIWKLSQLNPTLAFPFFLILAWWLLFHPFPFFVEYGEQTFRSWFSLAIGLTFRHLPEAFLLFFEAALLLCLPLFFPASFVFVLSIGLGTLGVVQAHQIKKIRNIG